MAGEEYRNGEEAPLASLHHFLQHRGRTMGINNLICLPTMNTIPMPETDTKINIIMIKCRPRLCLEDLLGTILTSVRPMINLWKLWSKYRKKTQTGTLQRLLKPIWT